MSLYSQYVAERSNKSVVETEKGFATYLFTNDNKVYIEDIYVVPEHRNSNEASQMADHIIALAKDRGCTKVLGSVVPTATNSTDSLKVLLAYGMKLDSATNDFILFSKDII